MNKTLRDKIKQQALTEIQFARNAKQGVIAEWRKNEIVLKKMMSDGERANVDLGEGLSFVNTFLSKINSPYNFKYERGHEADLEAAKIVNAIKDKDAKLGRWSYKAMLARTDLIQYGRYIMEYHADSIDGYKSHLSNVSVYQFLIDPSVGAQELENAFYMGRGGIVKTRQQIQNGIKSGLYLKTEANNLLNAAADNAVKTQEEKEQENRWIQITTNQTVIPSKNQFKFWEWYTTYKGTRYYVLITETGGEAIRIVPLVELFESNMFPFFSVAAYPEITQFWTPAPLAMVREAIMSKATAINQLVDNGEAINRPMKAFDVGAIKNPAILKYRKDGLIPVKTGTDINKAVQFMPVTQLTTAVEVYDKLDTIVATQSGVTNAIRGQADDTKVGIYQGNQQNASDRFSLINDSEADGQYRFARLYLNGLEEHMTKKVAVEMVGIQGVDYKEVTKKDIKHVADFDINIVTAGTEETLENREKADKLQFLASKMQDPNQTYNHRVLAELEASIVGFNTDEVKRMLNKDDYGNEELMSEAAQDILDIINGKDVKPNQEANTAYQQKILDYVRDESDELKPEVVQKMFAYLDALQPIVLRNMQKNINDTLQKENLPSLHAQAQPGGAPTPGPANLPQTPATPPVGPPAAPGAPTLPTNIPMQ